MFRGQIEWASRYITEVRPLTHLFAELRYATDEARDLLVLQPLSSGAYLGTLLPLQTVSVARLYCESRLLVENSQVSLNL